MIKRKINNEKGITMISLVITITVLVILTNVIIYNMSGNLKVQKLKLLQNDIDNLRNKISSYYAENGQLPANLKYTNIQHIKEAGLISDAIDAGDFLVIDLSAIENLTLNYGKDYEKIKGFESISEEDTKNYTDLYIINEASHNIFYVEGIALDSEVYYTDYSLQDLDSKAVELKYIDSVKIPDGFYYVSGTKDTGIIIKDNDNNQYKWILQNEIINEIPEGIEIEEDSKEEFIESVNAYKGYYKSENNNQVIYLELEKWSPIYDANGKYVDKNGDAAIIPAGFQVSQMPGENTVDNGLVIQDEKGNQFVWVPVSKTNFATEFVRHDYGTQEIADADFVSGAPTVNKYAEYTGDGETVDENASESEQEAQRMYRSVKQNGGFYIGRYEAGNDGSNNVLCKKDSNVYNYIGWSNSDTMTVETGGAVEKARGFDTANSYTSVTSTLVYGVQWDAVMRWISNDENLSDYLTDSSDVGNYDTYDIIQTGSVEEYQMKNIFDMAGNVYEWTMEAFDTILRVTRGGIYDDVGSSSPVTYRYDFYPSNDYGTHFGFRVALYLND